MNRRRPLITAVMLTLALTVALGPCGAHDQPARLLRLECVNAPLADVRGQLNAVLDAL